MNKVMKEAVKEEKMSYLITQFDTGKEDINDFSISEDSHYIMTCSNVKRRDIPLVKLWEVDKIINGNKDCQYILYPPCDMLNESARTDSIYACETVLYNDNGSKQFFFLGGSTSGNLFVWFINTRSSHSDLIRRFNFSLISFENLGLQENTFLFKKLFVSTIVPINDRELSIEVLYLLENTMEVDDISHGYILQKSTLLFDNKKQSVRLKENKIIYTSPVAISNFDYYRSSMVLSLDDGKIVKIKDINNPQKPILIGKHNSSVKEVKIIKHGTKVISFAQENEIHIWDNNDTGSADFSNELKGHNSQVLGLIPVTNDNLLISIDALNQLYFWDLERLYCLDAFPLFDNPISLLKMFKNSGFGDINTQKMVLSNNMRYIFISVRNHIFILWNKNAVKHFIDTLQQVKKRDRELYHKIYADNILQIMEQYPANLRTLKMIYDLIKERLKNYHRNNLHLYRENCTGTLCPDCLKNQSDDSISCENNQEKVDFGLLEFKQLSSLYISDFLEFEDNILIQHKYLEGIKDNYHAFWDSIKKDFSKRKDTPWSFRLFFTTDQDGDLLKNRFIELTSETGDKKEILMKNRVFSMVKFVLVLDNLNSCFLPLINDIEIYVENNKGQRDLLVFSNYTFDKNFIKILDDPAQFKSGDSDCDLPNQIAYSFCTYKLNGYKMSDAANITIRRIRINYSNTLNPVNKYQAKRKEKEIFRSFSQNMQIPNLSSIKVILVKGFLSAVGLFADIYSAKMILTAIMLGAWRLVSTALAAMGVPKEILNGIDNVINISVFIVILKLMSDLIIPRVKKKFFSKKEK